MKNPRKTTQILDLEKPEERVTVKSMIPRATQLALLYDQKLSNTKHFKFVVRFMEIEKELKTLKG